MTNKTALSILFVCFVVSMNAFAQSQIFVANSVRAKIKSAGSTDVFLILREQADFVAAERIIDRTQRVREVYNRARQVALATQAPLIKRLEADGLTFTPYYIVNAIQVKNIDLRRLNLLARYPGVAQITLDFEGRMPQPRFSMERNGPVNPSEIPDHLRAIGVDRVWNEKNVRGANIVVAGQDTGYQWQHPALKHQYRGFSANGVSHDYSWHDAIRSPIGSSPNKCGYKTSEPCDDDTHGTHTMGTIVGFETEAKTNRIGAAPESKWIGCRNMDAGNGRASTYLECFQYFLAPWAYGADPFQDGKAEFAPHIINNSWGCPAAEGCKGDEFVQAIKALTAAGILVVVSAGNDGPSCGTVNSAPALYTDLVVSVAAYDHRTNNIAFFSSRGPSTLDGGIGLTVSAPGNGIRSSIPGRTNTEARYGSMSGTSMAGPHVAGAAALLWSARPDLIGNIPATIDILKKSARPLTSTQNCGAFPGSQTPNAVFGHGLMDVFKALE